jgi:hypothetical protein
MIQPRYTHRKLDGDVTFRREWEVELQHFSVDVAKLHATGYVEIFAAATREDLAEAMSWISRDYLRPLKAIG